MAAELATTLVATEADRLEQAEALVRAYCGWHIAPSREDTATFRADAYGTSLMLPSLHVTAVDSVTQDGTLLLVNGEDYAWSTNGVLTRYWWPVLTYYVEFTHGYAEPPAEVTAVVQAVAQRAVANPGSLVRTQVGPFADTYSQTGFNQSIPMALLAAEKDILDPYKIPPRP